MSNQNDWLQFYNQQNFPSGQVISPPSNSATAAVTTTATTITSQTVNSSGGISPEGRISKPIRRRSRASRRTPTTLLNTDTTNFRAMVQQFTGGPCNAPFQTAGMSSNLEFGFGTRHQAHGQLNPNLGVMEPASAVFQLYQQQQQNQQYMFSVNNNTAVNGGAGGGVSDTFYQRLSNNPPRHGGGGGGGSGGGGFVMDHGLGGGGFFPSN
ncbi:putative VQ motif-containing protein [Quillaja saponaria]|uniref:VQ motif-containing protein n=1 Tax=Quillaja saponaria TaxID=32244 RepID=A0AAD7PMG8_QUISA|nr:putative VQ motif-containing protein [Quillaja saponaria]